MIRPHKGHERLSLRAIREGLGLTQTYVARAADLDQGEISRIERRSNLEISTLQRYAGGLGATCEIVLVFPDGRRVHVALPEP
jgi:transcriptional regulator with XRE-family HTH domain